MMAVYKKKGNQKVTKFRIQAEGELIKRCGYDYKNYRRAKWVYF